MLESIAQDFHETTDLESIYIEDAEKLQTLPRGLDKLSHLQEIEIRHCLNLVVPFEESELPWTTINLRVFEISSCSNFGALPKCINNFTFLQELTVSDCSNVGALPKCINNFTSLRELIVSNCSAEISFPEVGFPTNLTSLVISNAPKLYTSLVQWGLNRLTSLKKLSTGGEGCSNVASFPDQGIEMTLPPSLTEISIENFENLEFMCSKGFQHLTSLQQLYIYDCPKLTSLPEKDMLFSLEQLHIRQCPLLEEWWSRGKGREWAKISHIPLFEINDRTIIPRQLD